MLFSKIYTINLQEKTKKQCIVIEVRKEMFEMKENVEEEWNGKSDIRWHLKIIMITLRLQQLLSFMQQIIGITIR